MIVFGIKGWNHSSSEFNGGEHLMNFNIAYHFADFEEYDKTWLKLIGTMLETDTIIFCLTGVS